MRSLRLLPVLVVTLASACKEPPASPPKKVERADPNKIPAPGHSPEALSDPGKPMMRSAAGQFDLTIDGQPEHLAFVPPGKNFAVQVEERGVARVRMSGSRDDSGYPALRISLEHLRLDALEFPAKLEGPEKHGDDERLDLTIRYETSEARWWESSPEDTARGKNRVTLETFEDRTLTGSFSATLHPRKADLGEPKQVEGTFEVELRLTGVEPGTKN